MRRQTVQRFRSASHPPSTSGAAYRHSTSATSRFAAVVGRIVAAGTITIESAAEHGTETLHNLRRPGQVQQMLQRLIGKDGQGRAREAYGGALQYERPPGSRTSAIGTSRRPVLGSYQPRARRRDRHAPRHQDLGALRTLGPGRGTVTVTVPSSAAAMTAPILPAATAIPGSWCGRAPGNLGRIDERRRVRAELGEGVCGPEQGGECPKRSCRARPQPQQQERDRHNANPPACSVLRADPIDGGRTVHGAPVRRRPTKIVSQKG
jgi:hypothetical protein